MDNNYGYLDRNVSEIRERIEAAKKRRTEHDGDVLLLAAIKSAEVDEINYIHRELGICDVGENRVQQLLSRYDALDREGLNIHFIGKLQTNKVKYIIDKVCMIHSLDSLNLAKEIDKQAKKHGIVMDVLVEINSGMEESKGGVMPSDVRDFCLALKKYEGIRLCGFMTMAPKGCTREEYREYFTRTRKECEDIWKNTLCCESSPVFSMGMSDSYEIAIECGSDIIRLGNIIFSRHDG